jgi:D-ribose pyranase
MKKKGILHSELARIVAGMGHGDILVICDSGFPIPHNRPVADVILTINVPRIIETLNVILEELHVEISIVTD